MKPNVVNNTLASLFLFDFIHSGEWVKISFPSLYTVFNLDIQLAFGGIGHKNPGFRIKQNGLMGPL